MPEARYHVLVDTLLRAGVPLSGDELAAHLNVSTRTVRTYVKEINRHGPVVISSHRGYIIDRRAYSATQRPGTSVVADTPDKRLQFLCRDLAKRSHPVNVFDLSDRLSISDSTLETDLTRAREVFRQHELRLRRERDLLWVEGDERSRRRLVREMLHNSTKGLVPAMWQAFSAEFAHVDVQTLRVLIAEAIESSGLEFNDFALGDLMIHLLVTVERVRDGNYITVDHGQHVAPDPHVLALAHRLGALVAREYDVALPPSEFSALCDMIAVRAVRGLQVDNTDQCVDPDVRAMVADILEDVSHRYRLGQADTTMQLNLALHVQNLIARAGNGVALTSPLGQGFRNGHPLVHDLALYFAGRLETRKRIRIGAGEIDYLSFHMALQYMRYLEQRDLLTITLVVPRYYDLGAGIAGQLGDILRGQAVIEQVATVSFDFSTATSDLIVSCVEPSGPTAAPVVLISPFLTGKDRDHLLISVRQERERNARRRVRTTLTTLIDPRSFVHIGAVRDREAALALLCEAMTAAGYVDASFYADVLDRENRSSTAFGGEFAIPHSMYMDANATGVGVLVCDRPIPWGGSGVRLVLLFALSPDGRQTFRDVLDEITGLLSEAPSLTTLIDSGANGYDSFMAALTTLLDS